jgi:hypothetical protein
MTGSEIRIAIAPIINEAIATAPNALSILPMTTRNLRKLRVETASYFWRVYHRNAVAPAAGAAGPEQTDQRIDQRIEVFTASLEGARESPLRILFPATITHNSGSQMQRGMVFDYQHPQWSLNLNRPRSARLLIELAQLEGWVPEGKGEFTIADGYELVRTYPEQLDAMLNPVEPEPVEEDVEVGDGG